jgi:outer membrane protein assembly factor BamB
MHRYVMGKVLLVLIVSVALPGGSASSLFSPGMTVAASAAAHEAEGPDRAPSGGVREQASYPDGWPMAGANPQRTSWTPEQVSGRLDPIWYRVIEPYIPPKIQIIAAYGLLYVSTAQGLYALHADSGSTAWVYPTELPLARAPTIFGGVAYVGGFDGRLHAIDAFTGEGIWTFQGRAAFETNPLVLELDGHTYVCVGNRDGALYAIEDMGNTALLAWQVHTEGPVLFSPAYLHGTIYFASNDSHAYAVDARTGALVWKSARLPGAGFQAWWPVLYETPASDAPLVILAGSQNYRLFLYPGYGHDLQGREIADIYDGIPSGQTLAPVGADGSMDVTRILEYYEQKPWRRTYLVLDGATGEEAKFTYQRSDGTTGSSYAPILWLGTHSGNRYPPVLGSDGLLYEPMHYISDPYIAQGGIVSWAPGASSVTLTVHHNAMDEPIAYAAGGDLIYWNRCNDRVGAAFDPRTGDAWTYFSYNLDEKVPGYNVLYEAASPVDYTLNNRYVGSISSRNGLYGQHGHQNPPIPYNGKVYMHRSNTVMAFGHYNGQPTSLPIARAVDGESLGAVQSPSGLRQMLQNEVDKILDAGHLRPGYRSSGTFDNAARNQLGDRLIDYWHDPSEMLYTLILALPHLSGDQQERVRAYLQSEYTAYPPYQYTHVGWRDGAPREPYDLPPEVEADCANRPASVTGWGYQGWTWPPQMFYALWKYAEAFGSARQVFDSSSARLESPPPDAYLIEYPYVHNAYIAGYWGYLELETLAGYPESSSVRAELQRLLELRVNTFSKDLPQDASDNYRALSAARNFMFLVPELGRYLHDQILDDVRTAVNEYNDVVPYWFVSDFDVTTGEGANQPFYDYYAIFQAKVLILQEPQSELLKYLDVPAVQVGDLYYIQNLIAALGAPRSLDKVVATTTAEWGETVTYSLSFSGDGTSIALTDTLPAGLGVPDILEPLGTTIAAVYDPATHTLTWSDTVPEGGRVSIRYRATVAVDTPALLLNMAEVAWASGEVSRDSARLIANAKQSFLPVVRR